MLSDTMKKDVMESHNKTESGKGKPHPMGGGRIAFGVPCAPMYY